MKKIFLAGSLCLLMACTATGPQSALDKLATAMEKNDNQAFVAQFDMDAYAANFLKTMTRNNEALSSLNALGQILGLGNIDQLVNSIVNVKAKLTNEFNRGVASGELMAQCRTATTPDCPWVPASLRQAQIKELGPDAAIARVTTPERLTCWLALHKFNDSWLVVGNAVLETDAAALAKTGKPAPGQVQSGTGSKSGVNI